MSQQLRVLVAEDEFVIGHDLCDTMAEAGYADGVEVNFFYPPGRYLKTEEVVQNIADQLDELRELQG